MPVYILERRQVVGMELSACWDFFSNPANLAQITPASLRFQVRSELPSKIYPGLMIRYTVRPLFGIPMSWLTEIVHVDEPGHFVDEQRSGPYRLWHHEHFFRATGNGETEVRDLIHYVPPFGLFGAVLNALVVRRQLR